MERAFLDGTECRQRSSWFSGWLPSWCPTSASRLKEAEDRILQPITIHFTRGYVPISSGNYIWTLGFNETKNTANPHASQVPEELEQVPLVLLHGFGAGVGLWVKNLPTLAQSGRPVYALDLLGFGRSSRPAVESQVEEVERLFIQSLEEWREAMGLQLMILLGHDLGAYIAAAYVLSHPHRVKHLVLVEPWGFPARPEAQGPNNTVPLWIKALGSAMNPFNPLALLRLAGPLGPILLQLLRSDFKQKYLSLFQDNTVPDYIYHLNVQTPSGETAFRNMTVPYGWAQRPMMQRVNRISPSIPISVICGSRSCIDSPSGPAIRDLRPGSCTDVIVIRGAGHYVFADQSEDFNNAVLKICRNIQDGEETIEDKKGSGRVG